LYYFTRWINKSYPIVHHLVVQTPDGLGLEHVWVSKQTGNLDTSDTTSKFKSPVTVYIDPRTGRHSKSHFFPEFFFRGDLYTRETNAKKVWRF